MKYFRLTYNSSKISETGTQFQSIDGIMGDIQQNFMPFEGKINFPFKLPEPKLQSKAKPTTFLNVVFVPSRFLVLKKYFITFLSGFNIDEFQTWNLKVHHNNSILNDYELFILCDTYQRDIIDFKNSDFFIVDFINQDNTGEKLNINSYDDFIVIRDELSKKKKLLKYNKIILNLYHMKLDLFRIINTPASGYYVSEKLKKAIEKEKFTGFSFQEIEETDGRIKVVY